MASARNNIPGPVGYPIIGNVLDVNDEVPIRGIERLADTYGPIFKLNFLGKDLIVVTNHELLEELCDEKRFWKASGQSLDSLSKQGSTRYGLFVAPSEELMDWQQAHRILTPAFGPLPIKGMYPEMHDIASQMILKWARLGPSYRIPVTLDFTRLTLDTIALCSMDARFNSFYQEEMHPFVAAMNTLLSASSDRLKPAKLLRSMLPWDTTGENVEKAREYMGSVAKELVQYRRENPTDKRDLLNAMIHGKDPKTGESMDDELITAEMVTFLVAGHETTSGLLSQ
jgi:cytochrome P450/NADPH-cytochrome P450 reductase